MSHLPPNVVCQRLSPTHALSRPSDYLHPKGRRRAFSSIRCHALAIISTCIPASITYKCPAAFQRLPTPRVRPMSPLVHAKSRPSDRLHLHPNIVSQRSSAPTNRPPTSHFAPQRLFCNGPLMTISREYQTFAASTHPTSRSSSPLYLHPTLYPDDRRHLGTLNPRLRLCDRLLILSKWFALTIPCHLPPTSHIPVLASMPDSRSTDTDYPSILTHVHPTLPFPASLWSSSDIAHPTPSFHQLSLPHHVVHLV